MRKSIPSSSKSVLLPLTPTSISSSLNLGFDYRDSGQRLVDAVHTGGEWGAQLDER